MVKHFLEIVGPNELCICYGLSLSLSLFGGWGQLNKLREQKAMWENGRERERKSF
jgi:hypothetical protein